MKKGKFLIDAYKKINEKSFNIDEAVQFFVDGLMVLGVIKVSIL